MSKKHATISILEVHPGPVVLTMLCLVWTASAVAQSATNLTLDKEPLKLEQKLDKPKPVKPKKLDIQPKKQPVKPKTANIEPKAPAPIEPVERGPSKVVKPDSPDKLRVIEPKTAPGKLNKDMVRPDLARPVPKPDADGLKGRGKLLEGGDPQPLQANTPAAVDSGSGLRIDPKSSLARELKSRDMKDLAIKPRIREDLTEDLRDSLGEKMGQDGIVKENLQGLSGDRGSTLGEGTGLVGGGLDREGYVSRNLNNSKSGLVGPDPGSRLGRVGKHVGYYWTDPNGNDLNILVVDESTADAAGGDPEKIIEQSGADGEQWDVVAVLADGTVPEEGESLSEAQADTIQTSIAAKWAKHQAADEEDQDDGGDSADMTFSEDEGTLICTQGSKDPACAGQDGGEAGGGGRSVAGAEENPKPRSCDDPGAACNDEELDPADGTLRMADDQGPGGQLAKPLSQPGSGAIDTDPDQAAETIVEAMDANKVEQRIQEGQGAGSIDPSRGD